MTHLVFFLSITVSISLLQLVDKIQELFIETFIADLSLDALALRHTEAAVVADFSHVSDRVS